VIEREEIKNFYPCLSIANPFADYILQGSKNVEYRNWTTKHRGPLYVHASKSTKFMHLSNSLVNQFYFGGIIGTVELLECRPRREQDDSLALIDGKGFKFSWVLSNPIRYENPIKCNGKLSLFRILADTHE
jgi:predicted transcriptional regulator